MKSSLNPFLSWFVSLPKEKLITDEGTIQFFVENKQC